MHHRAGAVTGHVGGFVIEHVIALVTGVIVFSAAIILRSYGRHHERRTRRRGSALIN